MHSHVCIHSLSLHPPLTHWLSSHSPSLVIRQLHLCVCCNVDTSVTFMDHSLTHSLRHPPTNHSLARTLAHSQYHFNLKQSVSTYWTVEVQTISCNFLYSTPCVTCCVHEGINSFAFRFQLDKYSICQPIVVARICLHACQS